MWIQFNQGKDICAFGKFQIETGSAPDEFTISGSHDDTRTGEPIYTGTLAQCQAHMGMIASCIMAQKNFYNVDNLQL